MLVVDEFKTVYEHYHIYCFILEGTLLHLFFFLFFLLLFLHYIKYFSDICVNNNNNNNNNALIMRHLSRQAYSEAQKHET